MFERLRTWKSAHSPRRKSLCYTASPQGVAVIGGAPCMEPASRKFSFINMLALHQTLRIPADHILHLSVPSVPKGEEVEVLVLLQNGNTHASKIAMIAEAAHDPLYRQDLEEIVSDFEFVDTVGAGESSI